MRSAVGVVSSPGNFINFFPTLYLLHIKKSHTEEYGQELIHRVIGVLKYVHTGFNAYLKNQTENYSKFFNSLKSKSPKSPSLIFLRLGRKREII